MANWLKRIFWSGVGVLILPVAALFFQSRLIYYPRQYAHESYRAALDQLTRFDYESKSGAQTAFLFGEVAGQAPKKVWWCFGGNGALAADWMIELHDVEAPDTIFVLVDYPGYGYSEGHPNPKSIARSTARLQQLLAERWKLAAAELNRRSAILGHSLGCAAGLDMAARSHIEEIVAISPFTTMKDMAAETFGNLVSNLLHHRFNNEKPLDQIVAQSPNASILIFHGTHDEVIPFRLGQALATRHPGRVEFRPVERAGHNDVVSVLGDTLRRIVAAGG